MKAARGRIPFKDGGIVNAGVRSVLERAVVEGRTPGFVAEISDCGGRWFGGEGFADTETGRDRSAADRFRIASITKAFTATVVLQLADEGRLDLDDPVERWLPGLVRCSGHDGRGIIVRQLLNNTSGVFNYVFDESIVGTYRYPDFLHHRFGKYRPEDLVKIAVSNPPDFEPGDRFKYSNTNYIIAGMVVESVTGGTLADEISHRIAHPLGLRDTYLPYDPKIDGIHTRHYSTLYSTDGDAEVFDTTETDPSFLWAGGGMISTTGDLTRFFVALLEGRLLSPAMQDEMFTFVSTEGSGWIPNTEYGLGIYSQKLPDGTVVYGGGGATLGSLTYTMGIRDGSRVVTSHVNGDWYGIGIFDDVLEAAFHPIQARQPEEESDEQH